MPFPGALNVVPLRAILRNLIGSPFSGRSQKSGRCAGLAIGSASSMSSTRSNSEKAVTISCFAKTAPTQKCDPKPNDIWLGHFFARTDTKRPGGIRTFPMLAFAGGVLYLFDPEHFIPFTGGLVVLGVWLAIFYRQHVREQDEEGEPNVGLVIPALNVHAYLLGAIALALPPWVAVTFTVSAVLLLTGRERLHASRGASN